MNFIKNALAGFLLIAAIIFISCAKDDGPSGPAYEFINQNAQGTIDGNSFVFGSGTAEDSPFNAGELSIDLYSTSETFTDPCELFGFGEFVYVFFDIPNAVGLYELSFSFGGSEDPRTVTLFNPENTLNIIATEGAVEILSISDTEVSGKIDARGVGDFVNGNFTVTICPE